MMVADLANGDVTKTNKNVRFGVRHAEKKSPDLLQSGENVEYIARITRRCYRRAGDRGGLARRLDNPARPFSAVTEKVASRLVL